MPVFFQQQIDSNTRLGIWKIEETDEFFQGNVPSHRDVTHPHKRLQHLAGRFLLQYLFPGFPYDEIRIADTRKPFVPDEKFHFSISHCGDYAAALVSTSKRVGVDVEIPVERVTRIRQKFLSEGDDKIYRELYYRFEHEDAVNPGMQSDTILWSVKEAIFKWFGDGGVDFREHIRITSLDMEERKIRCFFAKTGEELEVGFYVFPGLVAAMVIS
jgi:phosphopantetheinyl transferase